MVIVRSQVLALVPHLGANRRQIQVMIRSSGCSFCVMVANQTGDTRGENWYTDLRCLAEDATLTNTNQANALNV